jgi:hypothetical protein
MCAGVDNRRATAGLPDRRKVPGLDHFLAGPCPVLADAAVYTLLVVVGHGVMRMVTGPALADALARPLFANG